MMYLIAGGLLGAAVAILTLPWSRRDTADLSHIELGYASQGPRGAVAGALRVLRAEGVVRYSRQDGVTRSRKALPDDLDPLARAIHAGLGIPQHPSWLRGLPGVEDELAPVAERVRAAGLRVGRARRAIGLLAALAAPVTSVVALVLGVGNVATGLAVTVVTVLGAYWLVATRGITIRGYRTLVAAPRRPGARRVVDEPAGVWSALTVSFAIGGLTGWETPGGPGGGGYGGGDGGGGDGGGGGDSGGY